MGSDRIAIELGLLGVRRKNHDYVGPSRGFSRGVYGQAFFLRFGCGGAAWLQANTHGDAAVAKVQGMRVTL